MFIDLRITPVLIIMNSTSVNILSWAVWWTAVHSSLGMEVLGHGRCTGLALEICSNHRCQNVGDQFSPVNQWVRVCCSTALLQSLTFVFAILVCLYVIFQSYFNF